MAAKLLSCGVMVPDVTATVPQEREPVVAESVVWRDTIAAAAERYGTPCYIARWQPVHGAVVALEAELNSTVPVRSWLSFKTHPMPALARDWIATGRSVEVVSEVELY